ncbi:Calx-beta domain-containing protein [Lentzea nigeriaca]|uniref:Calx-beta domain-containing protein n=1 Tax=Lentzea nigeriaca TaxID=1128665 RepID=UPI00195C942B|nr:Calx-beta domain-containing protein [Lentzea nigeriaca]MBM7857280.1 hypothetical protein [Lentzea nigeriaca]
MKTLMVLLLLLLGIVPAHGAPDCDAPNLPDCIVVDALDGPVHERIGTYAATLKLHNGPAKQNVVVSYEFVDGTAKQGVDYLAEPGGMVTIKAGEPQAFVPYTVLRVGKEQKQFTLQITSVQPGKIGKPVAVFTIGGRR